MKIETRIKLAADIAVFTAAWMIVPNWRSHIFLYQDLGKYIAFAGIAATISTLMIHVVVYSQLISAIFLFRCSRWAWILTIIVLSVQILLTGVNAVRHLMIPAAPLPPAAEPGVTVITISLWPVYIRALLNAGAVMILFSRGVRSRYLKQ